MAKIQFDDLITLLGTINADLMEGADDYPSWLPEEVRDILEVANLVANPENDIHVFTNDDSDKVELTPTAYLKVRTIVLEDLLCNQLPKISEQLTTTLSKFTAFLKRTSA